MFFEISACFMPIVMRNNKQERWKSSLISFHSCRISKWMKSVLFKQLLEKDTKMKTWIMWLPFVWFMLCLESRFVSLNDKAVKSYSFHTPKQQETFFWFIVNCFTRMISQFSLLSGVRNFSGKKVKKGRSWLSRYSNLTRGWQKKFLIFSDFLVKSCSDFQREGVFH